MLLTNSFKTFGSQISVFILLTTTAPSVTRTSICEQKMTLSFHSTLCYKNHRCFVRLNNCTRSRRNFALFINRYWFVHHRNDLIWPTTIFCIIHIDSKSTLLRWNKVNKLKHQSKSTVLHKKKKPWNHKRQSDLELSTFSGKWFNVSNSRTIFFWKILSN